MLLLPATWSSAWKSCSGIWGSAGADTSAEQGQDGFWQPREQVGTCGDLLWWWMHFSHHLLLPRLVLGNLSMSHFPWDVTGLQVLMCSISQWEILGGRRGGATKPMKLSFSINALSPFHASMFNLGLHYKCLSSQSSWSWWTSGSLYVANTIQALSTYMVLLEQLC